MVALPKFLRKLRAISIKRCLGASVVMLSLAALFSTGITVVTESASGAAEVSHVQSGSNNPDNVICGGAHSHGILVAYTEGRKDSCGHADIRNILLSMGITTKIAKAMKETTFCISANNMAWISAGRKASPDPSTDVWHSVRFPGGVSQYRTNFLSKWGPGCYELWLGHTADGRMVGVLVNCGNPVNNGMPATRPKPPAKPVPTPAEKCVNGNGHWDSADNTCTTIITTTNGNCTTSIAIYGNNNTVTSINTYTDSCNTNTTTTTQPTTVITTPPTPATVSCSLALNNPSGNTVNATVYLTASNETSEGASITWVPGVTTPESVNGGTASGSYTFPASGTYTVTASVQATGSTGTVSSQCSKSVTITPPTAPQKPQVSCSLVLSNPSGNTVNATVYLTASNETSEGASITWASGVTTPESVNGNMASGSYTFSTYGTYTVSATVQATGSGGTASSQCSWTVVIPAPPVKPQVSCSLVLSNPSGNTVNATVYIASNETNNAASITWAPNVTTSASISGTTAQGGYTFSTSGTYTVSATVQATGSTGSASSQCSLTITIPPTVVVSQPPLVNNVTQIEFVYIGYNYPNICADITAPSGDSLTVTFSAVTGNFPSASFTFISVGTNQVCTTYYAPTNPADIGSDTITVTATDTTTHLYGVGQSASFPVEVAPSNP